jgi:predicted  nucleic acid-binding Zn-ribbon protein
MVPMRRRRFEAFMPTTDERIAYLEGRFEEHSGSVVTLRGDFAGMRSDVQADFAAVRSDVQDVRRQVESLDHRMAARIDALDTRMARQFTWTVGIQVAILLAVMGALLRLAAT